MTPEQRAEALRLADALERDPAHIDEPFTIAALLRELAAVPDEPVAWQWLNTANYRKTLPSNAVREHWRPLYAAPQA